MQYLLSSSPKHIPSSLSYVSCSLSLVFSLFYSFEQLSDSTASFIMFWNFIVSPPAPFAHGSHSRGRSLSSALACLLAVFQGVAVNLTGRECLAKIPLPPESFVVRTAIKPEVKGAGGREAEEQNSGRKMAPCFSVEYADITLRVWQ